MLNYIHPKNICTAIICTCSQCFCLSFIVKSLCLATKIAQVTYRSSMRYSTTVMKVMYIKNHINNIHEFIKPYQIGRAELKKSPFGIVLIIVDHWRSLLWYFAECVLQTGEVTRNMNLSIIPF